MKLNDILVANEALKRLSEKRFSSYAKMRELVKLRKAVEQEVDFYAKEETKAVNAYAEVDEGGSPVFLSDGRLRLKDMEAKIAFEKEIATLRETEVDGIVPITDTFSLKCNGFYCCTLKSHFETLPDKNNRIADERFIFLIGNLFCQSLP